MAKPNTSGQNSNNNTQQNTNGFSTMMDFSKFMPSFSGFDLQSITEANRRNAEAFTQAGQRAMESMQAILQRQNEMVREGWQETTSLAAEVMTVGNPQEKIAKQTEAAKASIEKAVSNSRELTEMLTKCNMETAQALTSCFTEAMGNVRGACAKK